MEPVGSLRLAPVDQVRARIARLILGQADNQPVTIGSIELRPHQRSAVMRLRESLCEFGGAVLCDPVGTGKTFIALALPPADARIVVVAPAVLKRMWSNALDLADRSADFVSFESLSRGSLPECEYDFVIVDEAHHARNPKTARYRVLSQLISHAKALLMTATPIHNRRADLVALMSLFLGERAAFLKSSELTRCVIRRDQVRHSIEGIPEIDTLTWIKLPEDERIPHMLLSLPPPLPPRDGGDGGVLIARSLIRQWASSDAALLGGLKRRILRAESLIAALSDNTWPTRQELLSWASGDDSVQLGLPGILATESSDAVALLEVVQRHAEGLKNVFQVVRASTTDMRRAALISQSRQVHNDRTIVAFSEFADTVNGLFSRLMSDGRVCALTASGACVAGGPISRSDAIAHFAPIANGCREPAEANAITLLLTTDLLSEGVNLQDAGVVIHLDLPWTPARMEQRLGRVARVGSRHERVMSYAFRPPASVEAVVRIERILRQKLDAAGIVTPAMPFMPGGDDKGFEITAPQRNEAIRCLLSDWLQDETQPDDHSCILSAVSSDRDGFIAIAETGRMFRLIAKADGLVSENATTIVDVLPRCLGTEVTLNPSDAVFHAREAISWLVADMALPSSGSAKSSIRAIVTRQINRILRNARTHDRARLAQKAERVLAAIDGNLGTYDEQQLQRICEQASPADRLLDEIIELAGEQHRPRRETPKILAMIVFVPR